MKSRLRLPRVSRRVLALAAALLLFAAGAAALEPGARPGVAASPTGCVAPPAAMTAWWPLDEPAGSLLIHDVAGSHLHNGVPLINEVLRRRPQDSGGALPGLIGPGPVQSFSPDVSPPAMVGSSLLFAGHSNTRVVVPDSDALDAAAGPLSIDAWVYPREFQARGLQPILDKYDDATNTGYRLEILQGELLFRLGDGTAHDVTATGLVAGKWQHVAVTLAPAASGGVDVRLFIGGAQVANRSLTPAGPIANALEFWLGAVRNATEPFGEIALDEVHAFSAALTPAQVQAIAAAGSAGLCGSPYLEPRARLPMLVGETPAAPGVLETPGGLKLTVERVSIVDASLSGVTAEFTVALENGSDTAQYVLIGVGAENPDLGVEIGNQRQVCSHNFMWWHWDCFNFCTLPSEPSHIEPIDCPDASSLRVVSGGGGPPVPPDRAPADLVIGIATTSQVGKLAAGLHIDPAAARFGPPPLPPGATWRFTFRLRIDDPALLSGGTVYTGAIALADDLGGVHGRECELSPAAVASARLVCLEGR